MAQLLVFFATSKCSQHVIKWFNRRLNLRRSLPNKQRVIPVEPLLLSTTPQKNTQSKERTKKKTLWMFVSQEMIRRENAERVQVFTSVRQLHPHPGDKSQLRNVPKLSIPGRLNLQSSHRLATWNVTPPDVKCASCAPNVRSAREARGWDVSLRHPSSRGQANVTMRGHRRRIHPKASEATSQNEPKSTKVWGVS